MFLPLFSVFSISSSVLWPCVFFLWKGRKRKIHKTLSKEVVVRTTPPTGQACSWALLALQCPHHVDTKGVHTEKACLANEGSPYLTRHIPTLSASYNPSVLSMSSLGLILHKDAFQAFLSYTYAQLTPMFTPSFPFFTLIKHKRFLFVSLKSTAGQ